MLVVGFDDPKFTGEDLRRKNADFVTMMSSV